MIIPIVINDVSRKAKVVEKQPDNSTKLNIRNSLYNFYEVVETIGEDIHYWTYAVAKRRY